MENRYDRFELLEFRDFGKTAVVLDKMLGEVKEVIIKKETK